MTDRQKEIEFLRDCISYHDSDERHELGNRIAKAQRDERCVRRAVLVLALFIGLAVAGLCYSAVFLAAFPQNKSQFVLKAFAALGLGSLICMPGFLAYWSWCRRKLRQRRQDCRRLALDLFQARFGKALGNGDPQ